MATLSSWSDDEIVDQSSEDDILTTHSAKRNSDLISFDHHEKRCFGELFGLFKEAIGSAIGLGRGVAAAAGETAARPAPVEVAKMTTTAAEDLGRGAAVGAGRASEEAGSISGEGGTAEGLTTFDQDKAAGLPNLSPWHESVPGSEEAVAQVYAKQGAELEADFPGETAATTDDGLRVFEPGEAAPEPGTPDTVSLHKFEPGEVLPVSDTKSLYEYAAGEVGEYAGEERDLFVYRTHMRGKSGKGKTFTRIYKHIYNIRMIVIGRRLGREWLVGRVVRVVWLLSQRTEEVFESC